LPKKNNSWRFDDMRGGCVSSSTQRLIVPLLYIFIMALAAGCSKSADDLYTEGRQLILEEATFEKGIETLLRFEKKFPDDPRTPEVILAVATGYQSAGMVDEAAEAFGRLIENYPESPETYKGNFLLGYMYYDTAANDKAKTILTEFIKTYPDSELSVSARVLLDNIGRPVEEWSIVRELGEE